MLALGVPARIIGPLDEAKQRYVQHSADSYVRLKEAYRTGRF